MWDVGGQDKIRPLWRHYFQNTQGEGPSTVSVNITAYRWPHWCINGDLKLVSQVTHQLLFNPQRFSFLWLTYIEKGCKTHEGLYTCVLLMHQVHLRKDTLLATLRTHLILLWSLIAADKHSVNQKLIILLFHTCRVCISKVALPGFFVLIWV